jgi:ADP-heptose:LPS heptosyltransferase
MFVGYDSAGGHVAAACGVPMVSLFAGYPSERFFERWRPDGDGPIQVVKCEQGIDPWPQLLSALNRITAAAFPESSPAGEDPA